MLFRKMAAVLLDGTECDSVDKLLGRFLLGMAMTFWRDDCGEVFLLGVLALGLAFTFRFVFAIDGLLSLSPGYS